MAYQVTLTYFRGTGKYYTTDSYVTAFQHMHEIVREVQELNVRNELPGVHNPEQFLVHIDVPEHPQNVPHILNVVSAYHAWHGATASK